MATRYMESFLEKKKKKGVGHRAFILDSVGHASGVLFGLCSVVRGNSEVHCNICAKLFLDYR